MADEQQGQILPDDPLERSLYAVEPGRKGPQLPPRPVPPPALDLTDPREQSLVHFRALGEAQRQHQAQSLRAAFETVAQRNSADEREAFSIAAFLNRDPARVRANLDAYREIARKQGYDYGHLLEVAPAVAEFASQHPGVIVDDLSRAGWWEWLTRAPAVAWKMGQQEVEFGLLGFDDLAGMASIEDEKRMAELERTMGERYLGQEAWLTKSYVEFIRQLPILAGSLKWGAAAAVAGAGGAVVAGQLGPQVGLPEEAITVPGAALAAGGFGMWSFNSALEAGHTYKAIQQEFRRKGLAPPDDLETRAIAALSGSIAGTLETASQFVTGWAAGAGRAATGMATRKTAELVARRSTRRAIQRFVGRSAATMGTEVSTEILQELTQIGGVAVAEVLKTGGTDLTTEQVVDQAMEIAVKTMQATTFMGPLAASSSLMVDIHDARKTTRERARMEMLAGTVRGMELLEQAPEAFRELARKIGSRYGQMEAAHISVRDFNAVAEAEGVDPTELAQQVMGETDRYAQAVSEGGEGDIVIPMSEFLTNVVPTPLYDKLKSHVRLSQAALSEQQLSSKAEGVREVLLASLPEVDTSLDRDEQTIYTDIYGQMLDETGDPSLADLMATMNAKAISNMSRRAGRDPLAVWRTWNLRLEGPDNARVAREVDAEVRRILEEREAGEQRLEAAPLPTARRGSAAIRELGQVKTDEDFYRWVRNMGGIRGGDRFSDLPAGDDLFGQIPGWAKNSKSGKTISQFGRELMQMPGSPFADEDEAAEWMLNALQNPKGVELPAGLVEVDMTEGSSEMLEQQLQHDTALLDRVGQIDELYRARLDAAQESGSQADVAQARLEIANRWLELGREFGNEVVDLLLRRDYGTSLRQLQSEVRRSGYDPAGEASLAPYDPRYEPHKLALWIARNGGIDPKARGAWAETYSQYSGLVKPGGRTLEQWAEAVADHWPEVFPGAERALQWLAEDWAAGAGKPQQPGLTGHAAVLEVRAQKLSADIQELIREAREQGVRPDAAQIARAVLEDSGWTEVGSENLGEGDVVLERETGQVYRVVADGDQLRLEGRASDLPLTAFNFYSAIPLGRRSQRFHQKKTAAQLRRGTLLRRLAPYIRDADVPRSKNHTIAEALKIIKTLPSASDMASVAWDGRKARRWYQRSARMLVDVFGAIDAPRFVALLSAMSPRTPVDKNMLVALKLWAAWDAEGRPQDQRSIERLYPAINRRVMDSWAPNILRALTATDPDSIVLSGAKVSSFARNLRRELRHVTNDVWMSYYFGIDGNNLESETSEAKGPPVVLYNKWYIALTYVTRKAADLLSRRTGETWLPAEVQASVWAWARTLKSFVAYDEQGNRISRENLIRLGLFGPGDVKSDDFAELIMTMLQAAIERIDRDLTRAKGARADKLGARREVLYDIERRAGDARGVGVDPGSSAFPSGATEGFTLGHARSLRDAARRLDERFPIGERKRKATRKARLREPGADYSPAEQEQRALDALDDISERVSEFGAQRFRERLEEPRAEGELRAGDRVVYRGSEKGMPKDFAGTEGTIRSVGGKFVQVDWDRPIVRNVNFGSHPAKLLELVEQPPTQVSEAPLAPGERVELDGRKGTIESVEGFGSLRVEWDEPLEDDKEVYFANELRRAGKVRGPVRVLGRDLPAAMKANDGSMLLGSEVQTPADLATIASVLRDRRIETLRHFWADGDGMILAVEAGSSGMPGYSSMLITDNVVDNREVIRYWSSVARRAQRLLRGRGVRHFWMMHNHPSATPTASWEDLQANQHATHFFLREQIRLVAAEGAPKGSKLRIRRLQKAIDNDTFHFYLAHQDPFHSKGAAGKADTPGYIRKNLDDLGALFDAGVLVEPRGHVVIDHDRYTWIGPTGELESAKRTYNYISDDAPDPLRHVEDIDMPHPQLRADRKHDVDGVAVIGSQIVRGERDLAMIYTDTAGRVVAIEEIRPSFAAETLELAKWVRGRMPEYGARDVFVYTQRGGAELASHLRSAVQAGVVRDAIIDPGTTGRWSAVENGIQQMFDLVNPTHRRRGARRFWEQSRGYSPPIGSIESLLRERQRAYNGSAMRFPRFSVKHIGSGEDTLNYGWGLYFTSVKAIAAWYRQTDISRKGKAATLFRGQEFRGGDIAQVAEAMLPDVEGALPMEFGAIGRDTMRGFVRDVLYDFAGMVVAMHRERTSSQKKADRAASMLRDELLRAADNRISNIEMERDHARRSGKVTVSHPAAYGRTVSATPAEIEQRFMQQLNRAKIRREVFKLMLPNLTLQPRKGQVAEVEIPGPGEMLHWYKKIRSDENDHVYEKLIEAGWVAPPDLSTMTGRDIYAQLTEQASWVLALAGSDKRLGNKHNWPSPAYEKFISEHPEIATSGGPEEFASRWLDSIGVRGVAYVGRTSGESGYVVFNDEQVSLPVAFYQDDRGRIDIDRASKEVTIVLTDAFDASTVFHEMAHFYLEVMADLAAEPGATDEILSDWAEVMRFLRVKAREDIGVSHHERFAQSFEEYLRKADAPSEELRSVFSRIRALMLAVYSQAEKLVNLSPRVKDVFDRMLATEQEIAAARSAMRLEPIEALARTMSPDELDRYREAAEKAAREAEEELRVAALADAEEFRENLAGRREAMADELRRDWAASRLMTALHYLQRGRMIEGPTPRELLTEDGKSLKLGKEALIEEFGASVLKRMARGNQHPYTTQSDRAVDPGALAELLGYESAAELVGELTGAPNYQKAFDEELERRVEARYGDIMRDPAALTERAMDAVVAPAALEQLLVELDHARRQLAPNKAENAAQIDRASLKAYADRVISGKTIMDLQPHAYAQAAQRHGTKAQKSTNPATIHRERMLQLVNLALYREARDARLEADRALRYARRMLGKSTQQMLGKADSATADPSQGVAGGSYQGTVNKLLEHFELRPESRRSTQRRQSLRDWVSEQLAEGEDVVITPRLVELTERAKKHFRELRVDEFRDLRNALQNIEGLARLKTRLLDGEDTRDFRRGISELIDAGDANLPDAKPMWDPEVDRPRSVSETISDWVDTWDSKLLRMEEIIDRLDGRDVRGPWTRLIWQPIVEAQNAENEMTATVAQALVEQFEKLGDRRKQDLLTEEVQIRRLGRSILKQTALVVALNTGNAGNYDRLLRGGMGLGEAWGPEVIEEILSTLSREDWDFVQGIWDTLESLWPQIADLEKRVTNVDPPKVERVPFRRSFRNEATGETETLTFEGGYYPIVYSRRTRQAQQQARESESMLSLFGGKYVRAMTPHGHVQTRVDSFGGELSTSLETVVQHVTKVIHDLTHREATMQIYRILHDREFMQWAWDRMGEARWKAMETWLRRIIQVQNTNDPDVESFIRKGRLNVAAAAMGFKATVSLQNIVNLANVVEKVPVRWLGPAMRETARHPVATRDFVHGKSGEMRYRFRTLDRDIREALQKQGSVRGMTGRQKFVKKAQEFGFGVIAATDMVSAYPAWLAAYRQALAPEAEHGLGLTEKQAVAHADRAVRTTLSAGGEKDIANIQASSSELLKALTMFYGWFSTAYMRFRALGFDIRTGRHREEGAVARGLPWYLARIMAFWIVPATVAELLANRGPDDDDDEGWAQWFITKTLSYPLMTVPILRDAASLIEGHLRGQRRSARFGALSTMLEETTRAGAVLMEEAVDLFTAEDFDEDKAGVAAARMMGYTMGLPSSQFEITGGYLWDVMVDGQEPRDVVEFTRHLLYRRSPEERNERGREPVARRD